MRHYPGRNPVLDALRGHITTRQLRVMVEQLPADGTLNEALGGTRWLDTDWVLYDVSTQLRALNANLGNIFRAKGQPPHWPPTLLPRPARDEEPDEERAAAEAELDALIKRKQGR